MKEEELFKKLCDVIDTLLGPQGCPWDQKQTLVSLRHSVLEETCELIDTIEDKDSARMNEELGDLLLNVVFLAKVAAKEGHFTLSDTLQVLIHKLISRHPHVFGTGQKIETVDELVNQWEAIKKKEKAGTGQTSMLDGIPKTLPSLSRAQKIISKMKRAKYVDQEGASDISWESPDLNEEMLGNWLFEVVRKCDARGLDAELALRRACALKENAFRQWEK